MSAAGPVRPGRPKDAEPGTLRYRLWHLRARLVRHTRKRVLKISAAWPWKEAFTILMATAVRTGSTQLTSPDYPCDPRKEIARRGRSRCRPEHIGRGRRLAQSRKNTHSGRKPAPHNQ